MANARLGRRRGAGLLLVTLGWVIPWYVLWLLPWAALAPSPAPRALAVALTLYLLLSWAPETAPCCTRSARR
jgi:hypothetical protein